MDNPAKRRLVENEVLQRKTNQKFQHRISKDMPDDHDTLELYFYCECSREDCEERILISGSTYKKLHNSNKRFIAKPGHENLEVETVVSGNLNYIVIEKFVDPAKIVQIK